MDRREFLAVTTASLGAAAPLTTLEGPLPRSIATQGQRPSVVVVGAGAFGVWTALYLREQGHAVTERRM